MTTQEIMAAIDRLPTPERDRLLQLVSSQPVPSEKLLEQVRAAIRLKHYSYRTPVGCRLGRKNEKVIPVDAKCAKVRVVYILALI
jgi:hypothetical protein